ncbi:MAG: 50S ribosomal protein L24 [Methanosarcinales archaeon]|nr:50S ribosomal protein L24 [Methanosarcinales archaeon]
MKSTQPRKQRKARYNAKLHQRQKLMSAPLSQELQAKYNKRNLSVREGDTVMVMRGDHTGKEGIVELVDLKHTKLVVEGVSVPKADGTEVPRPIHPSNVMITKLDLKDDLRELTLSRGGEEQ